MCHALPDLRGARSNTVYSHSGVRFSEEICHSLIHVFLQTELTETVEQPVARDSVKRGLEVDEADVKGFFREHRVSPQLSETKYMFFPLRF